MTCKSYRTPVGGIFACRVGAVCAVLVLAIASCVHADPIIGDPIDWETTSPTIAWDTIGSAATAVETTTGGNGTDWLKISFPGDISEDPGSHWYETAKVDASDLFSGTWITDSAIEFDFRNCQRTCTRRPAATPILHWRFFRSTRVGNLRRRRLLRCPASCQTAHNQRETCLRF